MIPCWELPLTCPSVSIFLHLFRSPFTQTLVPSRQKKPLSAEDLLHMWDCQRWPVPLWQSLRAAACILPLDAEVKGILKLVSSSGRFNVGWNSPNSISAPMFYSQNLLWTLPASSAASSIFPTASSQFCNVVPGKLVSSHNEIERIQLYFDRSVRLNISNFKMIVDLNIFTRLGRSMFTACGFDIC